MSDLKSKTRRGVIDDSYGFCEGSEVRAFVRFSDWGQYVLHPLLSLASHSPRIPIISSYDFFFCFHNHRLINFYSIVFVIITIPQKIQIQYLFILMIMFC